MGTILEREERVGAMVRSMSGDIRDAKKRELAMIYGADKHPEEEYRVSCVDWHWSIVTSVTDETLSQMYIQLLYVFYKKGINPSDNEKWKYLMGILLPNEFMKSIRHNTTQVPFLAMLDPTPLYAKEAPMKSLFSDIRM